MKASTYGIQNLKYEISRLPEWTSDDPKDIYGDALERMYQQIRGQFLRYCGHVTRNIGGVLYTYRTKEQPGDKYHSLWRSRRQLSSLWTSKCCTSLCGCVT